MVNQQSKQNNPPSGIDLSPCFYMKGKRQVEEWVILPPMKREDKWCAAFSLIKNSAKKYTPTPALYPSSKNTDSEAKILDEG